MIDYKSSLPCFRQTIFLLPVQVIGLAFVWSEGEASESTVWEHKSLSALNPSVCVFVCQMPAHSQCYYEKRREGVLIFFKKKIHILYSWV